MDSIYQNRQRLIAMAVSIFAIVVVTIFLFIIFGGSNASSSSITVTSDANATIYYADDPRSPYIEAGVGRASFSVETNSVYVLATNDTGTTATGSIVEPGESYEFTLTIEKSPVSAKKLVDNIAHYPYFNNKEFIGINTSSRQIVNEGLRSDIDLKSYALFVPFIKDARFYDENNLAFVSKVGEFGIVRNEKQLSESFVQSLTNERGRADQLAADDSILALLYENGNLYSTKNLTANYRKVATLNSANKRNNLSVDDGVIIQTSSSFPQDYGDDILEEEEEEHNTITDSINSDINIFDGNKKFNLFSSINYIEDATYNKQRGETIVSGDEVVQVIDESGNVVREIAVFGGGGAGVLYHKNTTYVLTNGGLWQLDDTNGNLRLIHLAKEDELFDFETLYKSGNAIVFGSNLVNDRGEFLRSGSTYTIRP